MGGRGAQGRGDDHRTGQDEVPSSDLQVNFLKALARRRDRLSPIPVPSALDFVVNLVLNNLLIVQLY